MAPAVASAGVSRISEESRAGGAADPPRGWAVVRARAEAVREMRRRYGLRLTLVLAARWLALPWFRRRHGGSFHFDGGEYEYLLHRHRITWANERAVEIPIALRFLAEHRPEDVLEVGNVLSHYVETRHRVVDKYDSDPRVERLDVLEIPRAARYQLVLSVSTLEHVGWDESPRDPDKFLHAVEHLEACLVPGGRLVFTVPLGYNAWVDRLLAEGRVRLTRVACLERVGDLDWRQVPWEAKTRTRYGSPFPFGNTIAVCLYEAP